MVHTGYDPALVALSIAIAVFASYTALDLGDRVRGAGSKMRGAGSRLPRSRWAVAFGRCTSSACSPSRWACRRRTTSVPRSRRC
uniref:MHYT domain-containing protein n=1 Tax=Methylobacterium tardum TaxID=374432 RepID=UPI001EDF5D2C|nr:MHYT domain-containing protein [Methylobacterium tardum]